MEVGYRAGRDRQMEVGYWSWEIELGDRQMEVGQMVGYRAGDRQMKVGYRAGR